MNGSLALMLFGAIVLVVSLGAAAVRAIWFRDKPAIEFPWPRRRSKRPVERQEEFVFGRAGAPKTKPDNGWLMDPAHPASPLHVMLQVAQQAVHRHNH